MAVLELQPFRHAVLGMFQIELGFCQNEYKLKLPCSF